MIKTINMDNQSVEINTSAGWLFVYRETFGKDILPELMPILEAIIMAIPELYEENNGEIEISTETILNGLGSGALLNSVAVLSTLEFTTILQIFWALAKNADKSIPKVDEWINQFDNLPLDDIMPELFSAVTSSMVSSKNLERLKAMTSRKTEEESPSTESSSEQSAEG